MNGIAFVRLLLFAGLAYIIYLLTRDFSTLLLTLALVILAVFLVCVNFYYRLKDQRALWEKLAWINTNELGLLQGELNGFPDGAPVS